mgnify:CR=1 FL=1
MISPDIREFLKVLVAEGALALLIIYGMQIRHELRQKMWITGVALVLVAAVAVGAYFEFGWKRYGTFMNNHDFYHYYTGTKYAPEIGYYNQYAASLLADHEQNKVFDTKSSVRNLETHGYTPTREIFANQDAIKGRFTPARWEEFKKDILYFQKRVPQAKWQQMLRDKGYNGTPVWSMVTGTFTNSIRTSNDPGMSALIAADPIILAIMFLFIWWAFGPWTALFAIAFFGTNFVTDFVHIKGALFRMDWIACIVISMCLVHKKCFGLAGAVLAYAAAARIFPAVFLFGMGSLACWDCLATRKINRDYLRFFATFFITATLLTGLSYLYYGPALWHEFIVKIGVHNKDISTTRVGFKYIFLWPFESFGDKVRGFEAHQTAWWCCQGAMLFITFFAARKLKPYQALGLGFVPAFFLTAPTFYYYILLIAPLLVFLPEPKRASNVVGASLFFITSIAGYGLHMVYELNFTLCFLLSSMYGIICLYMVGVNLMPEKLIGFAKAKLPRPSGMVKHFAGIAYVALLVGLFLAYRGTPEKKEVPTPIPTEAAPTPVDPAAKTRALRESMGKSIAAPRDDAPSITLALVGDIMLSRGVSRDLEARKLDYTYPFLATAPLLQTADIAFGNLECPVSGRGEKLDKNYTFNAAPEAVEGLTFAGFDVLSLANNHTLDYGLVALDDTIRILSENEIVGIGISEKDGPQEPAILERNGIRVGFLAYVDPNSPFGDAKEFLPFEKGPVKALEASLTRDIAALNEKVDIVVVSIHWGIEYMDDPDEAQIALGQFAIDQGADIVAGHHPHVQQEPTWYKDGLIIYSMGNFVFDQRSRPKTLLSRLYTVTLTKSGPTFAQYRPLELVIKDWQPRPTGPQYIPLPKPGK